VKKWFSETKPQSGIHLTIFLCICQGLLSIFSAENAKKDEKANEKVCKAPVLAEANG
jgi:hypothetical protein